MEGAIPLGTTEEVKSPNDKKHMRLKLADEGTLAAFLARLTSEEVASLEALKIAEPDLCQRWNDAFLMRFVWARKLNVERAAELLKNHVAWRKEVGLDEARGGDGGTESNTDGEFSTSAGSTPSSKNSSDSVQISLSTQDYEKIRAYMKCEAFPWSPGNYTKQGHSVLYLRAKHLDKELMAEMGLEGILRANWMLLDTVLDHDIDTARHGGVYVEDLEGASFLELMAIVRGDFAWDLRKISQSVQNNLPFRMAGILVLNAPWYIRLLMTCIKPVLKHSTRKKIHFCSVEDLHHYFTPEQLPTFYGGQYEVSTSWVDDIIAKRGQISEGKYVDPSPRSSTLIHQYSGLGPVKSAAEIRAEAKEKKKAKK